MYDTLAKEIRVRISDTEEFILTNLTWKRAQEIVEPIRINRPDRCISLYCSTGNSFIGNTSWNDQMKMFWEYPTYTPEGAKLAAERAAEAEMKGLVASWE
jgi:hypothetical protein